jgi:hypothetical protein
VVGVRETAGPALAGASARLYASCLMKILMSAVRCFLLASAAWAPGCVTETVVESPPSIKFPEQKQKHGFFDFLHFGSHPSKKTQTVVEPSAFPNTAPPEPQ